MLFRHSVWQAVGFSTLSWVTRSCPVKSVSSSKHESKNKEVTWFYSLTSLSMNIQILMDADSQIKMSDADIKNDLKIRLSCDILKV